MRYFISMLVFGQQGTPEEGIVTWLFKYVTDIQKSKESVFFDYSVVLMPNQFLRGFILKLFLRADPSEVITDNLNRIIKDQTPLSRKIMMLVVDCYNVSILSNINRSWVPPSINESPYTNLSTILVHYGTEHFIETDPHFNGLQENVQQTMAIFASSWCVSHWQVILLVLQYIVIDQPSAKGENKRSSKVIRKSLYT